MTYIFSHAYLAITLEFDHHTVDHPLCKEDLTKNVNPFQCESCVIVIGQIDNENMKKGCKLTSKVAGHLAVDAFVRMAERNKERKCVKIYTYI